MIEVNIIGSISRYALACLKYRNRFKYTKIHNLGGGGGAQIKNNLFVCYRYFGVKLK